MLRIIARLVSGSQRAGVSLHAAAPSTREYFYYIDQNGQLFLDETKIKNFTSCFKDKDFLAFFFTRLRANKTGRHEALFPYLSFCGREFNYLRCDDRPIVYTEMILDVNNSRDKLSYCNTGQRLTVQFHPERVFVAANGRLYYPSPLQSIGPGLIGAKLALQFSDMFRFAQGSNLPTALCWRSQIHLLTNELAGHFSPPVDN